MGPLHPHLIIGVVCDEDGGGRGDGTAVGAIEVGIQRGAVVPLRPRSLIASERVNDAVRRDHPHVVVQRVDDVHVAACGRVAGAIGAVQPAIGGRGGATIAPCALQVCDGVGAWSAV